MPSTEDEWNEISNDVFTYWNMPNCLGAIDGKLVHIQRPVTRGSQYYKRSFSMNMMAVVDATYRFLYVLVHKDQPMMLQYLVVPSLARQSLTLQTRYQSHVQGKFQTLTLIPTVFVADEAYPLKTYLMKPFSARGLTVSERLYNYRLSRARRTVENAFGILVNRFRILRGAMQLQPECVCDVVMACCALHNFMRSKVYKLLP